jgi:mannose/fructose/N-acetylgalactosamine-specific phosphotransferase system component IIB
MTWVLQRVDDRLIHGQVVVAWGNHLAPRRIWVVDDVSAANAWERDLLASTGPPGVEIKVVSVAQAIESYRSEAEATGPAFLLLRDLKTALALAEAGLALHTLNLGGLHYAPGKSKINEYVYLDEADRERARRLIAYGVLLEVQDVPASRSVPLAALDPRLSGS